MVTTGIANYLNRFEKRDDCKWPPEILMIPLKCIAASAPSK